MKYLINKINKLLSGSDDLDRISDSKIRIWKWNLSSNRFEATDFWYKKIGYNIPGKEQFSFIKEIIHPLDKITFEEKINNFLTNRNEKEVEIEFRIKTSKGSWFWLYLNGRVTKIKKNKPVTFEGIILDINTQKNLEEELKSRTEEIEALYEESEAQNEEMAAMMDELQRNQAELEEINSRLKINEYKYRTIFNNAPFGIIQSGFDGSVHNVNKAFTEIFRYDSEEDFIKSLNNTHSLYKDENVRDETLKNIDSKNTLYLPEQKGVRKDGTIAIVNVYYNKTINKYTGEEYLVTFVEDISELRSSMFERDLFFNYSGDLLGIFEFNGIIRQVNPAWTAALGWSMEELINSNRDLIIHPDDLPKTLEARERLNESDRTLIITNRYRHINGNYRIIRWNVISFKERGLIFVSGRDETERFEAEQELNRMWERLDIAIRNGVIGLWDYDIPEDSLTVNEAMTDLLGFDMHILSNVQREWGKYLHHDDLPQSLKAMVDHLKGKKEYYVDEYRLRLPDGKYRWFLSRGKISEYNDNGSPVRVSGSVTDITDLKESEEKRLKLEQKMQQAQKLESLGILAGGIAHDFNNLLMGVIGNTDILLYEMPENLKLQSKLLDIKKAAKRASELTNQMLAYSGRGKFLVEPINLNELVQEMSSFLGTSISKKVDLLYFLNKDLPLFEGDATQVRQVVMNIIVNASESIGNNRGEIKISTYVEEIDGTSMEKLTIGNGIRPGKYIALEISDTGCGIEQKQIKQIFDPFFTTKFTGRGLGLAAVLGIIKGHHGALKLQSEKDKGTTFIIYLPVTFKPEIKIETMEEPSEIKNNTAKLQVLIIDDEDYIRTLATRMLKIAGHTSFTAANGEEGIQIFQEKSSILSCVILDLTMPDLDGEEVLKELLKINPNVPVIISSGYSPDDITKRFKKNEISGFLQKPYQLSELLDAIGQSIK